MAAVQTIAGTQLLIMIETETAGIFEHPCLINAARGIVFSSDANSEVTPDCDNPDDPGWKQVTKAGMQATISGAGKLHTPDIEMFDAWFHTDEAKAVKVQVGTDTPVGTWTGNFKLTEFGVSGDRGEKAEATVTLLSDGEVGLFTPTP